MSGDEKIQRRQEFNRRILIILMEWVREYPELRFGQILDILGINNQDLYYTESVDIYEIICEHNNLDILGL